MTWFKVDDSFHAHPKVLATDADALGLWVVAGAWSSSNLTDGFVPDHVLTRLLPDSDKLARKLVAAGLWRRVRGGYKFHDWADFQPSSSDVRAIREKRAAAGRKGGLNSAKARSKPASKREASASALLQPPTRPLPSTKEGGAEGAVRPAAPLDPENPDWRTLPAAGVPRDPADAARIRRGVAAAREVLERKEAQ